MHRPRPSAPLLIALAIAVAVIACGDQLAPGETVDGGDAAPGDAGNDDGGYPLPGSYADDADLSSYPGLGGYGDNAGAASDGGDSVYPGLGDYGDASSGGASDDAAVAASDAGS
jgi:hypothetical protein